jgi:hypothetical protein
MPFLLKISELFPRDSVMYSVPSYQNMFKSQALKFPFHTRIRLNGGFYVFLISNETSSRNRQMLKSCYIVLMTRKIELVVT